MLKAVTLDEARHVYLDQAGRRVPGVTEVLHGTVASTSWYRAGPALELGRMVHKTTEYEDLGTLDHANLPDLLWPYLIAWRRFKQDFAVQVLDVERLVWHPRLRFAGTLDRKAVVRGRTAVIDIKSGTWEAWFALQDAGYALALDGHGERVQTRYTVRLMKTGDYEYQEYRNYDRDVATFVACLGVYNWKRENDRGNATA